jgi:type 1 fimbria pilin
MRYHRVLIAFFASALTALAAAPAAAQTPYDGLWNVTIVTKAGACEPTTRSTLSVADGKVSAAGANVSGSIGREGLVRV